MIQYDDEQFEIAYQLIKDIMERNRQDSEFLIKSIPHIIQSVSKEQIPKMQNQVLEIAKELDIRLVSSLPFLTVLSCLYERGQSKFPTAKRVLNPKATYSKENAYNVIADLNAIKLLTGMLALQKRNTSLMPTAFCTRDLGLALLWCGFNFKNSDTAIEQTHYSLNENLFPGLDENSRNNLIKIISE